MRADDTPAVLYVDDEPINLRVFDANFRNRFKIITCQLPTEALAILANRGHEIGVLISDQRMPELTGVELLERAKEIAPDVLRMVITAYSDVQAVIDAVNRGRVSRYFVKPWIKEDLLAALEDAMRIYQLQSRLREIETRMLRSERLAAIGQVSAGIAHELMNPVAYMTQNIEALRTELKVLSSYITPRVQKQHDRDVERTLDELPQILSDIETGSKHIREVALGIRGHARSDEESSEADLVDVAGFAAKLARSEVKQRSKLTVEGPPLKVAGGPVQLCQILLNLIVNSAQSLEGAARQGVIRVSWEPEGDRVRVMVKDNGCGIPPELQEKVFEPLFTTKAPGVGTGLGLAICKELVDRMGGQIRLQSTVGVGTTVELSLPRAAA
jgi:two-component system NtrC family sensor kinase